MILKRFINFFNQKFSSIWTEKNWVSQIFKQKNWFNLTFFNFFQKNWFSLTSTNPVFFFMFLLIYLLVFCLFFYKKIFCFFYTHAKIILHAILSHCAKVSSCNFDPFPVNVYWISYKLGKSSCEKCWIMCTPIRAPLLLNSHDWK